MPAPRRAYTAYLTLVAVMSLGCRSTSPDERLPELHGTLISAAFPAAWGAWSPSGGEVSFLSGQTAYSYHLASQGVRELYTVPPGEQLATARLSSTGEDWFTVSSVPGGAVNTVRWHDAQGTTVLSDRSLGLLEAPLGAVATYVVAPDSLFLVHLGDAPTLLGTGCGGSSGVWWPIVALSPDASRVVCQVSSRLYRVFDSGGGVIDSLDNPGDRRWSSSVAAWGAEGIVIADDCTYWICVYRQSDDDVQQLGSVGYADTPWAVEISRDARTVAYWRYCPSSACGDVQHYLFVVDVTTAVETLVAVHTGGGSPPGAKLAPDGSTIAYSFAGSLYLSPVP